MEHGQNTLQRVKEALTKSGYGYDGITSAQFIRMNATGQEIHRITFIGEDGNDEGIVFIDSEGKGEF